MKKTMHFTAILLAVVAASAQTRTHITVDASANQHPISPLIYGVNFATPHQIQDAGFTLNRAGGDSASMFNWQLNARSSGRDWFFESTPANPSAPMDQFGDSFVAATLRAGAKPMVTVPMIGWVAKLGPDRGKLAAYSILKYGLQQKTDRPGFPEAGNGLTMDGTPIHNNPNDAAMPDTPERESLWIRHLVAQFHPAAKGGIPFYLLDNEPARWHDIHRDVHPTGTHASELLNKTLTFAALVHAADPSAKVVAPEEWLPGAEHDSGFDQQLREIKDTTTQSDRAKETGGMDALPWLLTQWKIKGHPVDVVSVHFYPQGGEYSDNNSERMQLLRNRSTRLLWDTHYQDDTWMGKSWASSNIALIPHLRALVDRYYSSSTPIAITEYNWGADKTMSGAVAQADILGIFGRENLYMATRWIAPDEGTPTYLAMKLYRNYDNHGGHFGETSVSATVPDADTVAAFAALRTQDKALTIVVMNKQLHQAAAIDLRLTHFVADGTVEAVQLADGRLTSMPAARYHGSSVQSVLPPQSVTLLVLHGN